MSLGQFLQRIDDSAIGRAVEKRRDLLRDTGEPARIYVENVRSFFGVPYRVAKALLNLGVSAGVFERCDAILCPNDNRVLFDLCDQGEPPDQLHCEVCEGMEESTTVHETRRCRREPFYRLRAAE